nr:MAG TPA: hypothetical protein [Bacteriophage sp.]
MFSIKINKTVFVITIHSVCNIFWSLDNCKIWYYVSKNISIKRIYKTIFISIK